MADYFLVFFSGDVTLADAAVKLRETLDVVEEGDMLVVRWEPGEPEMYVGLNAQDTVVVEAAEVAEVHGVPEMATLDRRFEVELEDLEKSIYETNALIETQAQLQDLTGGYIVCNWNDNITLPE